MYSRTIIGPKSRWKVFLNTVRSIRFTTPLISIALSLALLAAGAGCASIRVTDPPRTATEQFLMTAAVQRAVDQLSMEAMRDRNVFIESQYLTSTTQPTYEHSFMLGELRARLLMAGARLANQREKATVIIEVRSGAVGIDRENFLLGIPSAYWPGSLTGGADAAGLSTPELSIVKSTKQKGYASVAIVAFWADTGAIIASSGPFVGRTLREDWWFFGTGPRTIGNIPTTELGR